ncbi:MAG TPA: TIGR03085 family metal-binding protein [Streptosporangiaceae bacterium]|nr:TIGR03085 family metal-binding protein [Streptosporangiaceae bacterium]
MTHAQDERQALCDLLAEVGPDQPTLCAGWQTSDLAAHLVLRERRPDAGAGVMGGPVARYTRRVQRHLADRHSFARLINTIRTGPPRLSVFGLPGADEKLNLVEYFVHHEDVLRARPDWQPRKIDAELTDELWDRLNMARLMLRKAPVGVELVRADRGHSPGDLAAGRPPVQGRGGGQGKRRRNRVRITAKARTPVVTVTGDPVELTLWTMGRTTVADVHMDGADADVAALRSDHWRS